MLTTVLLKKRQNERKKRGYKERKINFGENLFINDKNAQKI